MATENYSTIEKQISEEAGADYGYRQLHSAITITDQGSDEKIIIPYRSLSAEYMDYLKDYIDERELTELQWQHFKYNPQALSEALYGSIKFWALILEVNHCKSRTEFTQRKVRYPNPEKLSEVINEILMKEGW